MRRHPAALTVVFCLAVASSAAFATPLELSAATPIPDCIEVHIEELVQNARLHQAVLRVETQILDDDCGQTVQMVLWQEPDGDVVAEGLVADHEGVETSVREAQNKHPTWPKQAICEAAPVREVTIRGSEVPDLVELIEVLNGLSVDPVLEPLLVIHGLQYEIRIESGISESTYFFHAPGHPRPSSENLHPLDRWSQELRDLLGLQCEESFEDEKAASAPNGI